MQTIIGASDVGQLLDYLFGVPDLIEIQLRVRPALRDPDDDRTLELAARAGASIVTFNVKDFAGAEAYGVPVTSTLTITVILQSAARTPAVGSVEHLVI